jgi:hypothetical protein
MHIAHLGPSLGKGGGNNILLILILLFVILPLFTGGGFRLFEESE